MRTYEDMMKRQKALGDFGEFALQSDDLDEVLTQACRIVAEVLGTGRAKVLEIQEDGTSLLVRAGVGWRPDIVGKLRLPMDERSSETFAITEGKPVIMGDLRLEGRFDIPDFMKGAGVVALANVPIFLPSRRAYGLLQVDATEPRDFGDEDTEFLRTYTTILGPVIDRLLHLRASKQAQERFRLIVASTRDYAIFLTDAEDRITDWLPGAEAVYGFTTAEAIGQPAAVLFTPEDRDHGQPEKEIETARREGSAPNVRWHLRKDGQRVFIDGATSALHDDDGSVRGFLKIGQDVTARRRAETALRESEERFAQFAASSSDGLWIRNAATLAMEYTSPAVEVIYGVPPNDLLGDMERWVSLILPEDRDIAVSHMLQARSGASVTHEFRIQRPSDGALRWIRDTDFPLYDAQGRVQRIGGIAQDVTEAKMATERQDVMIAELQHRTRNLIAVVRGIADDTMEQTGPTEAFRSALNDRLTALSRVQGLLSRAEVEAVSIAALVRLELDALGAKVMGDRVVMAGPDVWLRNSTVQTLALALHELATNARKYGALSHERGQLTVTWSERSEDGERRLVLEWTETGLEHTSSKGQPTSEGGGYGRELIEQALPHALGARTTYILSETGVHCTIDLPARQDAQRGEAA